MPYTIIIDEPQRELLARVLNRGMQELETNLTNEPNHTGFANNYEEVQFIQEYLEQDLVKVEEEFPHSKHGLCL